MNKKRKIDKIDIIVFIVLTMWGLSILIPFVNVLAVSFSTQKEYLETPLLLWPKKPTLENYAALFRNGRILIGYRTTLQLIGIALPVNLFLTICAAYGLSRKGYPGRKLFMKFVVFTMLFSGGIIPLYLTVRSYGLIGSLWGVALSTGLNTFYMIIMLNFFASLPDSLIESAKLDGAGEYTIMFRIILPLSKAVLATVTLYYLVDRWNEWYHAMIMIRDTAKTPLQVILRSIILDSQLLDEVVTESVDIFSFSDGLKMGSIVVVMLPVMCVFPFLQKHFVKGVLIGAIKA
ncbi:MAG TPA: carbohydrate ABC transporter permease [Ruminiclostridium sp.]|jgi:putative aldouronate transport system permease protein|nr:carbohydrate ABC transporter permease [Clostridiaceae bacterium]HAA25305.1 carbohydrate ABC transporter permease [Ruminiclostridium sp.]